MATLSGPSFDPAENEYRKSIYDERGGHYNIYATHTPRSAMAMLRQWFPKGDEPDEMNLVFFSTSGVHGSYATIEEIEESARKYGFDLPADDDEDHPDDRYDLEVTFLLVQPRIVGMTYGNVVVRSFDDIEYLKRLRAASWKAAAKIGAP